MGRTHEQKETKTEQRQTEIGRHKEKTEKLDVEEVHAAQNGRPLRQKSRLPFHELSGNLDSLAMLIVCRS